MRGSRLRRSDALCPQLPFEFNEVLVDPIVAKGEKVKLVEMAVGEPMHDYLKQFIAFVADQNREDKMFLIAMKYMEMYRKKPNVDESFAIIFSGCYFSFDGYGFRFVASESRSEIEYTAELLDAFEVNGVTYHNVVHIRQVGDESMAGRGPVELYYAKHYGLIQYTIHYGITYFRLPAE